MGGPVKRQPLTHLGEPAPVMKPGFPVCRTLTNPDRRLRKLSRLFDETVQ
jgi:hypothetical protein